MNSVVFRPYRSGDGIELNHAFNEIFNQQRSLEEWQWKFLPFHNGSRIVVAIDRSDNDKIVAQYSIVTASAQVNGEIVTIGQPVDIFSYRKPHLVHGQIFNKLTEHSFKRYGNRRHCNVLFGFPGKRSYRIGRLTGLYPLVLPVPYFSKTVPERSVRGLRLPGKRSQHLVFEHCDPVAVDELWCRACKRYPISIIRTHAYLQRRFFSKPNNQYRFLSCYNRQHLVAWMVFQVTDQRCSLVDVLWDGQEERALLALEEILIEASRQKSVSTMEMWLSNDEHALRVFANSGWKQSLEPRELVIGATSFDESIDEIEFMGRFYFTFADSDLI